MKTPRLHGALLQALNVFDVCARLGSFTAAARELSVTQAAVSARIRDLEDALGYQVFVRERPLQLTARGGLLLHEVRIGLASIKQGLTRSAGSRVLRVTCTPTFAAMWLAPRLAEWTALKGAARIEVHASTLLSNIAGGEYDLAIRSGDPADTPPEHVLFPIERTPMLSPRWLRGSRGGRDPLRGVPLLDDRSWPAWRAAAGLAPAQGPIVAAFQSQDLAAAAAAAGVGAALLSPRLCHDYLRRRVLVAPSDVVLSGPEAYFVSLPERGASNDAAMLCDWLVATVSKESRRRARAARGRGDGSG